MAFLNNAGLERLWAHIILKLNRKVDKVEGKGLSTEDYTTEEKNALQNIANTFASKEYVDESIPTDISSFNNDAGYITIDEVPEGFSGSWNDLTDKPFYTRSSKVYEGPITIDPNFNNMVDLGFAEIIPDVEYLIIFTNLNTSEVIGNRGISVDEGGWYSLDIEGIARYVYDKSYGGTLYIYNENVINNPDEYKLTIQYAHYEDAGYQTLSEVYLPTTIPVVQSAQVGQAVVVKAVDENGRPTEWETVDPWVITSSTEGSTKQFRLTIDDEGVLTATEIE